MLEGVPEIDVVILRDLHINTNQIIIEYSTSDITAKGIDSIAFERCLSIPVGSRGGDFCGDYLQTSGTLVIDEGASSGIFKVQIVDDLCHERFPEFIQVSDIF